MLGRSAHRLAVLTVVLSLGSIVAANGADPNEGKAVYSSVCSICHSVQPGKNLVGPSLFGIMGRKTGSVPGFHYSPANQNANLTWDQATLDKYLQAPRATIPGTSMIY